jgi:hypothetical protein
MARFAEISFIVLLFFFVSSVLTDDLIHSYSSSIAPFQELKHAVTVVNIEVPVRVFRKGRFENALTIEDFEVFEDGKPQLIEAVYLVKKTMIDKGQGPARSTIKPKIGRRHFVLIFEMDEYLPELSGVIDFFFKEVLEIGETVWIITPLENIQLKKEALAIMPRAKISDQMKARLKKDIREAFIPLHSLIEDVKMWTILMSEAGENASAMSRSRDLIIERIVNWKTIDESQFDALSDALKKIEGQKHVFFFYQKEEILLPSSDPIFSGNTLRREFYDHDRIHRAFADPSITFHFLHLLKTRTDAHDVSIRERDQFKVVEIGGGGFFDAFKEIAVTTGGWTESSANPEFAFKKTVEAAENYYLLYYKPTEYRADGRYKEIKVKIKGGGYDVSHRSGYIAK